MVRSFGALVLIAASAAASEEVIVIEQDYNIIEQSGKDGPTAKDVRQKVYIHRDFLVIDENGGKQGATTPTETILVDFKNRQIIQLDHENKKKVVESFEDRRKRIETRKKNAEKDLADQPAGVQRNKMEKLFRALLDDKRRFKLAEDPGPARNLVGMECKPVKVQVEDMADYVPLEGLMHPDLELPYDNADVLYLLNIIGKHMAEFLRENREKFKYVPLELHLDLAAGGKLDTKAVSVQKVMLDKLDLAARGPLGNPFVVPDYAVREKIKPRLVKPKEERPD